MNGSLHHSVPRERKKGWSRRVWPTALGVGCLTSVFLSVDFLSVSVSDGAEVPSASSLTEGAKPGSPSDGMGSAADLQEQIRQLRESLALANADAETFRRQWQDLRLRDQALGIDALTVDEKRLQDRVVEAIKELYQTEQERRNAVIRLQQLLDAGQEVLKGANVDPQRRADYEIAVRGAQAFLDARGKPDIPVAASLDDGQIVHVNGELNAVILNVCATLGAKPGMPFRVLRDDQLIGEIKILQVRETVSAAVVDSVKAGTDLKVGDRIAVEAEK